MRKSSGRSLDGDEFKQLAYNKVIPQVKSGSQWLNYIKDTNQQVTPNWNRVYSGHVLLVFTVWLCSCMYIIVWCQLIIHKLIISRQEMHCVIINTQIVSVQ